MKKQCRALDIPTREECEFIFSRYGSAHENTRIHCEVVADVALRISKILSEAGVLLDADLIRAGALLHDLARGEKNHAEAGRRILEGIGFSRLAEIVGAHTDLPGGTRASIDEAAIVYLADKYVEDDRIVFLEERFAGPIKKYSDNPAAVKNISRRYQTAKKIKEQIEGIIESSLEEVIGCERG